KKDPYAACALCRIAPAEHGPEAAAVLAGKFLSTKRPERWETWHLVSKLEPVDALRVALLPVVAQLKEKTLLKKDAEAVSAELFATHALYRMKGAKLDELMLCLEAALSQGFVPQDHRIDNTPIKDALEVLDTMAGDGSFPPSLLQKLERIEASLRV